MILIIISTSAQKIFLQTLEDEEMDEQEVIYLENYRMHHRRRM